MSMPRLLALFEKSLDSAADALRKGSRSSSSPSPGPLGLMPPSARCSQLGSPAHDDLLRLARRARAPRPRPEAQQSQAGGAG